MEVNNNIIAIRKKDISLAYQAFSELMLRTETIMNIDARREPAVYRSYTASELEKQSLYAIQKACGDSPFDAGEVRLVSGQKFPDIIADKYYGVEVKSTKENHWTSTGSSIIESTRDVNVEDIYMLFCKKGGDFPEFKCRPYEDVLYDIAVTHSPRYLINMDISKNETIFTKMDISYNELRTSPDAIDRVRRYYREKAKQSGKQEMPWWITSENSESTISFNIRLWNTLECEEKRLIVAQSMILFPEVMRPESKKDKYNQLSLWLCSYKQIVSPNIRDSFSAGGKITHVNGVKLKEKVSQVFKRIVEYIDEIKSILENPTTDFMMLIKDYNPSLLKGKNMFKNWLSICLEIADEHNVPLLKWIEEKPEFTLSKNN